MAVIAGAGTFAGRATDATASGRHTDRILGESALARRLGASGTPTFLINGYLVIGAHPFETFKRILNAAAKKPSVPATPDAGAAPRP